MYIHWQNDKVGINIYSKYEKVDDKTNRQQILIVFKLFNGWHISWDNPGDAGVPTDFIWNVKPEVSVEKKASSTPEKFIFAGIISQYGYSKQAFYLFDVENFGFSENIGLKINWVACKDICEPEETDFIIELPAIATDNEINSSWKEVYEKALQTFPIPAPNPAFAENSNYALKILFPDIKFINAVNPIYFIPYQRSIFSAASQQNALSSENNKLELFIDAENKYFIPQQGILIHGNKSLIYDVLPMSVYENTTNLCVWYILLLAFLGGLLLNLMPCVFPILSIKALSLVHNTNRKKHVKKAFLYILGVISCFGLIAGILYVLRNQGENLGWGFQLQSPWFVGIMLIIFIFVTLMMFGVIKLSSKLLNHINRLSDLNSFFTGFFAVLITSPCTGPFMGLAIGYALFQTPATYFPIFLTLGLGYALPFALIELYPQAIKKHLPKPGKWMDWFYKILALPILLTCLWLTWILYNQLTDNNNVSDNNTMWQKYDRQQVQNLVAKNQIVFIDFTAKWCLTCLLNEKTTLNTEKFYTFAQKNNISLFKVDWTTRDENVTTLLKQYGRNGVPLYVLYFGRGNEFVILPQILTFKVIKEAFERGSAD